MARVIRWRPAHLPEGMDCRITASRSPETFHQRHEATRPWSPFNYELYARSVVAIRWSARVSGSEWSSLRRGEMLQTPLDGDTRARFLIDALGISEEIVSRIRLTSQLLRRPDQRQREAIDEHLRGALPG